MSDNARALDALDLHATVKSNGVSIHMDGDRDAELTVHGPIPGGEVHDGEVYQLRLRGEQNGVWTTAAFYLPADTLGDLADGDSDHRLGGALPEEQPAPAPWGDDPDETEGSE